MTDADDAALDAATQWLTDVLYTGVGLGVLAVNRFQVARRSIEKQLADGETAMPDLSALQELTADPERAQRLLDRIRVEVQDLDDRLGGFETRIAEILENLEPELPEGARDLTRAIRAMADDHAAQIRAALGLKVR